MWRVPSERITLDLDGPSVEVERIQSWAIQFEARLLRAVFGMAEDAQKEYVALGNLFEYVIREAQPVWDIFDHRGAVPITKDGFYRLGIDLSLKIVDGWLATWKKPVKKTSAVDAVLRPGSPLNLEVKHRLKKKAA